MDEPAVVVKLGIEILPPVAGSETIEFLETPRVGVIGMLGTVVPLSESGGGVPGRLEGLSNRRLIEVEALSARIDASHTATSVVTSGEELGPRGRADGANVEAVKEGPVARERVNVRR